VHCVPPQTQHLHRRAVDSNYVVIIFSCRAIPVNYILIPIYNLTFAMRLKLPRYKEKCEWGSQSYLRVFFCLRLAILVIARRVAAKIVSIACRAAEAYRTTMRLADLRASHDFGNATNVRLYIGMSIVG
jgi:hypothetical protein